MRPSPTPPRSSVLVQSATFGDVYGATTLPGQPTTTAAPVNRQHPDDRAARDDRMTIVAVCEAGGTAASTTTSLLLAATLPPRIPGLRGECDPSGGDIAAWAQLPAGPGWSSAVSGTDRNWSAIVDHTQELPSGLRVMTAPARPSQARAAVIEAASGFSAQMLDVAGSGDDRRLRSTSSSTRPVWARASQLTLLLVRQATVSAQATVARVDRTIEALEVLRSSSRQVGVVLIGGSPYPTSEVSAVLGVELFGVLPEDAVGAGLVCGGWTVGKRAARSPLAKAAAPLGARVVEAVYGRGHRFEPSPVSTRSEGSVSR